ncbi:MAG: helix-turn-helix domain-containing protein [Nitrospira sp.]
MEPARLLKFSSSMTDMASVMNESGPTGTVLQPAGLSSTDGEILTIVEVARFLRVPKSTVYKLARTGELPASKIGKHWRFLRRDIHEWMHRRSGQVRTL